MPAEMPNLPKALRATLTERLEPALQVVVRRVSDGGDTVKYLWQLHDGKRIETVLMIYPDRVTVCVSSQAGCAMACGFCATGQAGFTRHLTIGEIVEQGVGGPPPPPPAGRSSNRSCAQREKPVSSIGGSPTWFSWGWASRSPTKAR